MGGVDFNLLSVLAYGLFFLGLIFRAGLFQWFWSSVILWLAVGWLGSKLLPGIWGITHIPPLFLPHAYLTVGSIFFFIDCWRKTPDGKFWQTDGKHPLLSLFAVSNLLMTLAFLFLAALVCYHFPNGKTAFVMPALLKMYALMPVYWFVLQFLLMAVFYVHRRVMMKQPVCLFSRKQLESGLLLAVIWQIALAVILMAEIFS
ncbi:hypothetical protein [Neisseria perflava]|uniref:hypothetical protein n=1 Tax=Neisseria perflava TaxID=33053 RepID=UPI0020A11D96|nr:hypothetical protein [Neisseria perflava]MCP1659731.1 hypothetical protein [Neisseria perflava]MCP1771670.1 hypothetical protein [Neisseria perflava]